MIGLARALMPVALLGFLAASAGAATTTDPLASAMWESVRSAFLPGGEVVFDDAVQVIVPADIENSADVPLAIKLAPDLDGIVEIVVIVENNPVQTVVRLVPYRRLSAIGLKIRLEMSTPVRVAVLTDDGVWHVGSQWANVLTPGGCSAPMQLSAAGSGATLGDIAMQSYSRGDGRRLKLRIIHPMDTGFAIGGDGRPIPAYFINWIEVSGESGKLVDLYTRSAMAPDPVITLDFPGLRQSLRVTVHDSRGLEFESSR